MSYLKKGGVVSDEKPESIMKAADEFCIVKNGAAEKCIDGRHIERITGENLTLVQDGTTDNKLTPFNIDYGVRGENISEHNMNQQTIDGWKCQKWSSDSPNSHNFNWQGGSADHNYCRNPDGEPCDWCYADSVKIMADGTEVQTNVGRPRWACCAPPDQGWGRSRIYNQTLVSFKNNQEGINNDIQKKEACFGDGEIFTRVVNVGSSGSVEKIVPIQQRYGEGDRVTPTPINTQNPRWNDRFRVHS